MKESSEYGYREVSDFFNIREANANVKCGEWEYEISGAWMTYHGSKHHDDDLTFTNSIKYGITDDIFVELELLPINLGDGLDLKHPHNSSAKRSAAEDGTGEIALIAFWQFLHEDGCWPAMAVWAEGRFPTGEGSEKVDGTLNLNITKTICGAWRAHLQGFVETANGSRGDADAAEFGDRRHFQWGVGPGIDYQINACNVAVANWLNRSSDSNGGKNSNILEVGWVYTINPCSVIKAAIDAEPHAEADGPHWLAKVQYGYSWGH